MTVRPTIDREVKSQATQTIQIAKNTAPKVWGFVEVQVNAWDIFGDGSVHNALLVAEEQNQKRKKICFLLLYNESKLLTKDDMKIQCPFLSEELSLHPLKDQNHILVNFPIIYNPEQCLIITSRRCRQITIKHVSTYKEKR